MDTIAFSTKSLDWKTRYSFQPLHYARSGTDLISFSRSDDEAGVHLHDSSDYYNKFYGTSYSSKLSVVTNENPSATKIYEAFSFEANKGGWNTTFTTETGETQRGTVGPTKLVEKEGKFYSSVPQNALNLDSVTNFVGSTTLEELIKPSIKLSGRLFGVPGSHIGFAMPEIESFDGYDDEFIEVYVNEDGLSAVYAIQNLGELFTFYSPPEGPFGLQTVTSAESAFQWTLAESFPYITGYDPYSNSLIVNDPYSNQLEGVLRDYLSLSEEQFNLVKKYPVKIFSFSNLAQSGEDMRGEFMKIDIERSGTDYYELFAINVDQHQTKLDHSLGQNN